MTSRSTLALVVVLASAAACMARPPQRAPRQAAPAASTKTAETTPFLAPVDLPGCSPGDAEATRARFKDALQRLHVIGFGDAAVSGLGEATRDLAAAWASPCFAHVARFFPAPRPRDVEQVRALIFGGLEGMVGMVGGVYARDGRRSFIVPPSIADEPSSEAVKKLAPSLCPDGAASCGHAATFVARAHEAFDASETRGVAWHAEHGWPMCEDAKEPEDGDAAATRFESWAKCIASEAPRTHRYPALRFRAAERGWLVLRGRRGHYSFADEARAYDLTTGAAYVARSESALVMSGGAETFGVDRSATDAKRKPEAFTGNVSAEAARELAFVLATVDAPVAARTRLLLVPLPQNLEVRLSPRASGFAFDVGEIESGSSDQTSIGWSLVDGEKLASEGRFTWPHSWRAGEAHAEGVLAALEAGLERGCARAELPARFGHSASMGVSAIDADEGSLVRIATELDRALAGLRAAGACRR